VTSAALLVDELLRIGRQAGLDAVGICDARPFDDAREAIEKRQKLGYSAGMQFTYRNPARSTDPARTMDGVQSMIVGARSYVRAPIPAPSAESDGAAHQVPAAVARYSWTDHYLPLRQALSVVAGRLKQDGWRAQVVADDNAVVDRAAAVRAGLGWYGKNTNVLIPEAGSWFVIGSVLTDAPLAGERPEPVPDGCGTCQRCIDDCPTGAIVAAGQLDARRCLAWLLQAPGVFPVEYRQALGDRIYGCDECQSGCPVNKISVRRHPPPAAEDHAQATVDVIALLDSDDAQIEAAIRRWYIPGRELRYVRRNALIVLANTADGADPEVRRVLRGALSDADPIVRSHAVWAASQLGCRDLLTGLIGDQDPLVQTELAASETGRR
jgi:epoxyqueuosine reductase